MLGPFFLQFLLPGALLTLGVAGYPKSKEDELQDQVGTGIVPGQHLIGLKSGNQDELWKHTDWVEELQSQSDGARAGTHAGINETFSVPGFHYYSGVFDDEVVKAIRERKEVSFVEEVRPVSLQNTYTPESSSITLDQADDNWGLSAISYPDWKKAKNKYAYVAPAGQGTYIYILDTGINADHDEFEGRVEARVDFGPTHEMGKVAKGNPSDRVHGTHVAGIAAGATCGVANKATIIDVQVFTGSDQGNWLSISSGLRWAILDILGKGRQEKAVINMSLAISFGPFSETIERLVHLGLDWGIPIVIAAGNKGLSSKTARPGRVARAMTVAAMDKDYKRWEGSNWGQPVDIFAPGVDIKSADAKDNKKLCPMSGTSMATPFVSGVIAYLLALEGPRPVEKIWDRLEKLSLKKRIKDAKKSPNRMLQNGIQNRRFRGVQSK